MSDYQLVISIKFYSGDNIFFCNWGDKSPMLLLNSSGKARLGFTMSNNFVIFTKTIELSILSEFDKIANNTAIHEMGHQNGVSANTNCHVDGSHFDNHQHDENESCIMSSPANGSTLNYINNIFEFDIDDNIDTDEKTSSSCLEAIRNSKTQ